MRFKIFLYTLASASLFILPLNNAFAGNLFNYNETGKMQLLGNYLEIFIDNSGSTNLSDIIAKGVFVKNDNAIPSLPVSKNTVWIKVSLSNMDADNIFLMLSYPNISRIDLYKDSLGQLKYLASDGNSLQQVNHKNSNPNYIFNLLLARGHRETYYIKIKSLHQLMLPIYAGSQTDIQQSVNTLSVIIGLYAGIILAVFFYNLFVYFSTKDKAYLCYILYIALLGIAQLTLSGHLFLYLWEKTPSINSFAVPLTSSLAGAAAIVFTNVFLNTKFYTPNIRRLFLVVGVSFIISAILSFTGYNNICYAILNYASLIAGLLAVGTSFYIARKGYRPAYFYFVSWAAFSIGLIIFVLSNLNVLPVNTFTTYILYFGSAIETVLLSIALADKINVYGPGR